MIKNLVEYFLPEQEFYLQNVSYSKVENVINQNEHSLNCIDNIKVDVIGNEKVRITITRSLKFEPEELFNLSVAFGAVLSFDPEHEKDCNWNEINLAEEFRANGDFVTVNLMSRITLLIAQITSSFGQQPLVLPPGIASNNEKK